MSVTSTNLETLTAYPLAHGSASVDNDNIQKLRTFAVADVRRVFASHSQTTAAPNIDSNRRRSIASCLIP